MSTTPLVIRPEDLDQGGPLVIKPEELDGAPASTPKPQKMGFKKSLRAGFGLKPEGTLSDDISQIGEGFGQMYHHPFTSANDIVEGLWSSQQDVAEKGQARMKGPRLVDKISGGAQYLESGIPLAGPILSRMGEQTEEGDYTGAAGTGLPLLAGMDTKPLRGAVGDVARTPAGAIKPGITRGGELAGGYLGSEALSEHPYIGAGLGYGVGRLATEMMVPGRTPKYTPWESRPAGGAGGGAKPWESQSMRPFGTRQRTTPWEGTEESPSDKGTTLSDQMSLMPEGGPKSYKLTPEQVPGLPELRRLAEQGDTRAQSELQRRGQQILIAPKEAGYPGARPGSRSTYTTSAPEEGAAPASPVSKSSETRASSPAPKAEQRGTSRPKGGTLSDRMAKQFALEESVANTTKRLKAEKDPAVKRHMQSQIDDFNKELKGLQ